MLRKGFQDMTLSDLASEVGTDRASIYYYTSGKEELLADMVLAALVESSETFTEIAGRGGPVAARLRECIEVLMVRYDRHFPILYVWVNEGLDADDGVRRADLDRIIALSQREFEVMETLVRAGVDSGELATSLPAGVVAQSIAGLVAWTSRWYEPGHALSAELLAEGLADMVLTGLVRVDEV